MVLVRAAAVLLDLWEDLRPNGRLDGEWEHSREEWDVQIDEIARLIQELKWGEDKWTGR